MKEDRLGIEEYLELTKDTYNVGCLVGCAYMHTPSFLLLVLSDKEVMMTTNSFYAA